MNEDPRYYSYILPDLRVDPERKPDKEYFPDEECFKLRIECYFFPLLDSEDYKVDMTKEAEFVDSKPKLTI